MSGGVEGHGELTARYEQLRGDALDRTGLPAHGFGLALFLQQGMAAWMRAWLGSTNEPQTPSASSAPLAVPLPSAVRAQLTLIVASMLAGPRPELHP